MKEKILIHTEKGIPVEIVTIYSGTNRSAEHVPTAQTLAIAVASCSGEWQLEFARKLLENNSSFKRIIAGVAGVESELAEIGDFGFDPNDSKHLLEIRQAIDSYLGWTDQKEEDDGDYVGRVRTVGEMLHLPSESSPSVSDLDEELQQIDDTLRSFGFDPEVKDAVRAALAKQRETIMRQRRELRFLNKREEDRVHWLNAARARSQHADPDFTQ
jgi:hypothetical protein